MHWHWGGCVQDTNISTCGTALCHAQLLAFSEVTREQIVWVQIVANSPFAHTKLTLPDTLYLMHANNLMGITKDWIAPEPPATSTKGKPQAPSKEHFLQSPPDRDVSTPLRPHTEKGQNCGLWFTSPQAFASLGDISNKAYNFKPLFRRWHSSTHIRPDPTCLCSQQRAQASPHREQYGRNRSISHIVNYPAPPKRWIKISMIATDLEVFVSPFPCLETKQRNITGKFWQSIHTAWFLLLWNSITFCPFIASLL